MKHNYCGLCICCDLEEDTNVWDAKYAHLQMGVDCCDPEGDY